MKNVIKHSILYLIFTIPTLSAHTLDKDAIVIIETEHNLQELLNKNQGPSAISFHMEKCEWCIKMRAIFESLANNNRFQSITFYEVNGPKLQAHLHVKAILNETIPGFPTIFFMNQGKIVDKQIGGVSSEAIIKKINKLSNSSEFKK